MKRFGERFLLSLLCGFLIFSMCPVSVWAAEETEEEETERSQHEGDSAQHCWLQRWRNRAKSQENTGGFKKLEKARKQTLPWGLQKGASSGDILISAERPSPYSDLQNGRIIILCCF